MRKTLSIATLIASILLIASTANARTISTIDKQEAKIVFEYLNKIRQSPKDYSKEIGINLRRVDPMPQLIWNDTLTEVAEAKALDMADRNYFSHQNKKGEGINVLIHKGGYNLPKDFLKPKKNNYFESIAMGYPNGIETIRGLILDKGINPPAHRQHLLGMTDFWATCYDIGIGFIRTDDPQRPTYICIIIARHDYPTFPNKK